MSFSTGIAGGWTGWRRVVSGWVVGGALACSGPAPDPRSEADGRALTPAAVGESCTLASDTPEAGTPPGAADGWLRRSWSALGLQEGHVLDLQYMEHRWEVIQSDRT